MTTTMQLLAKQTVGSGGASSVTFSNIPQTFTDLTILCSIRSNAAFTGDNLLIQFNGSSSNFTAKNIYAIGSGTPASQSFTTGEIAGFNGANTTSNTFSNTSIYITNYAGSANKSISTDSGIENNATRGDDSMYATLWSNTAAITSISLLSAASANFVEFSTFYLYGISNSTTTQATTVPYASGGDVITTDGSYWYHAFKYSGSFTPLKNLTADVLVVAGGGGGGTSGGGGGGGGAGGLLAFSAQSLTAQNYVCTVGSAGAGATNLSGALGTQGGNSQFGALTAAVGGGAGGGNGASGGNGGSGGGGAASGGSVSGGTATSGQGYAGGANNTSSPYPSGGGGGAGAVGQTAPSNTQSGAGGTGINTYSTWLSVTSTGASGYLAGGGGGGGGYTASGAYYGAGGNGGGGNGGDRNVGAAVNATANTGSGGGGSAGIGGGGAASAGGNGGSGIIIVRYAV